MNGVPTLRRRRWVARVAPLALCAWLAATAVPRAAFVVHHHDGDDRPHVHAFDDEGTSAHEHSHAHHHALAHRHHDHAAAHGAAELEAPDVAHRGHVHAQHPFQRAAVAGFPVLFVSETVQRAPELNVDRAPFRQPVAAPARAPPVSSALAPS